MDEYINREKAIEAIKQTYCLHCDNYNGVKCRACAHMDDIDIIEDTPTADVQPVAHAEWVCLEAEIGFYSCSKCGHNVLRATSNFCPDCGARMDGDNNG